MHQIPSRLLNVDRCKYDQVIGGVCLVVYFMEIFGAKFCDK